MEAMQGIDEQQEDLLRFVHEQPEDFFEGIASISEQLISASREGGEGGEGGGGLGGGSGGGEGAECGAAGVGGGAGDEGEGEGAGDEGEGAGEALLAEFEQKVQDASPKEVAKEVASLLENRPGWVDRRPTANKLLGGVRNTFFVEAGSAALGKRKKGEAGSSGSTAAEETMVVTADYGSASGGSLTDLEDGSHHGVLRISGSKQATLRLKFGKYCLVLLPGHPDYKDGSSETETAGRNKLPFQYGVPKKDIQWLVHATPAGEPEGTAVEQQPHTFSGDVSIAGSATVGKDLTVGPDGSGTVHAKVAGREADHAEFMPVFDEAEELNGGDVVALVGDTDGVQKVSRSARGSDRAEWRVVSTNPQMLGNKIYDEGAAVPIVLSGQVPIRVTGEPPVDAYLVPSGREDGCARVLSDEELPQNVLGQVVESRVKRGRVKALVQKGMEAGPMSRYQEVSKSPRPYQEACVDAITENTIVKSRTVVHSTTVVHTRSAVDAQKLAGQLVSCDSFAPDSGESQGPATRPVPAPSPSVPLGLPLVSEISPSNMPPMPPMPPARWRQSSSPPPQQQQAPAPQAPPQEPPPQQQQAPPVERLEKQSLDLRQLQRKMLRILICRPSASREPSNILSPMRRWTVEFAHSFAVQELGLSTCSK